MFKILNTNNKYQYQIIAKAKQFNFEIKCTWTVLFVLAQIYCISGGFLLYLPPFKQNIYLVFEKLLTVQLYLKKVPTDMHATLHFKNNINLKTSLYQIHIKQEINEIIIRKVNLFCLECFIQKKLNSSNN